MRVGYYPTTNIIINNRAGRRFPDLQRRNVNDLSQNEAREMTRFSLNQLHALLLHLHDHEQVCDDIFERSFIGEEALLHFLVYDRLGVTKFQLSLYYYFGGDLRRFSYSIRAIGCHFYTTFYHKISGDSLRQWMPHIDYFRQCLWEKVTGGGTIKTSTEHGNSSSQLITNDIPFDNFRIFGFLDDTGFRTTAPGIDARRRFGFIDDIQRAFYSEHFSAHGIKVKSISLPNGMIGSIFIDSLRVSDLGLLNMSNLSAYLVDLFQEMNIKFRLVTSFVC